jgi:hypothetical protein
LHFPAFQPNSPRAHSPPILNLLRSTILIALAATGLATAGPEWQRDITSLDLGNHPRLEPIALDYQASWKGVLNSGHLHMEFAPPAEKKPGTYVVKAYARSQGAAAQLHPYQFDAWAEINPGTLRPRYIRASETDKNGKDVSIVRYFPDRVECHTTYIPANGGKIGDTSRTFSHPGIFDIFSVMLHIRSQPLADGDQINVVIQSTDQPYLLRVRCLGREMHNGQKTIKLSAGMEKIDRTSLELKTYKKLKRNATLWLTDDYDRVPLEVRADIFLGDVRVVLTQRKKL